MSDVQVELANVVAAGVGYLPDEETIMDLLTRAGARITELEAVPSPPPDTSALSNLIFRLSEEGRHDDADLISAAIELIDALAGDPDLVPVMLSRDEVEIMSRTYSGTTIGAACDAALEANPRSES